MTDDTNTDEEQTGFEFSEKGEENSPTPDDYREALLKQHDTLDNIKSAARALGGELENLLAASDDHAEKEELQKLVHMSVLLYERVDRGDKQLVRGL